MAFDLEESITQLIEKPPVQYNPPARYISKYRDSVRSASISGKSSHQSLGVPNVPLRAPSDFLRKNSRSEIKRNDVKHKHYHVPNYQHKLPPWEKIKVSKKASDEAGDAKNEKSPRRNFEKRNIINVKKLQPRKPRMYYVDDRRGSSHPLIPSGLYPLYRDRQSLKELMKDTSEEERNKGINRPVSRKMDSEVKEKLSGLGETLQSPGKIEEKDKESVKTLKIDAKTSKTPEPSKPSEATGPSQPFKSSESTKGIAITKKSKEQAMCRYVTDEERAELLYGMKKKWEEMMHKFQCLPFLTDTPPKAKRKAKMEEDLKQLEKDIDLIERHPHIYVYEGNS